MNSQVPHVPVPQGDRSLGARISVDAVSASLPECMTIVPALADTLALGLRLARPSRSSPRAIIIKDVKAIYGSGCTA